jgi:predicted aspartyl protease
MKWGIVAAAALWAFAGAPAGAQDQSAAALFASGDFPGAAAAYQAILRTHPDDATAQLRLGTIRLYENDVAAAGPLLRAAAAAQPQNAQAQRSLAELNRRIAEAGRAATVDSQGTRVPLVTADPLPVVRVVANGHSAYFIVDTGADVDLEPSFAASIGVATQSAGMGTFAGGKQAALQRGILGSLALGGAVARDVPVHVLPTHAAALYPSLKIDGIVGTTYFERFLVTIDYPNAQLIVRPRSAQGSAAFEAAALAAGAASVPCYLVGDHFVFANAQVNDAPPGLFLFDSGLAGGGLMPTAQLVAAAKIQLQSTQATTGMGGGGAVTAVPFTAQRVQVGSAVQRNVGGLFTPQGSPLTMFPFTVWGAISNDFLRHYAYTVDFDAMRVVLAPPAPVASAQAIFDASFLRLQSYPVPPYAVMTDTWHITQRPMGYYTGESSSVEVHRYAVRLSDGMENVSDPSPDGKLPPALILPEFLGPFAWTMRSSVHVAGPDQAVMMQPDVAGLKTIASVVAVAKPPYAFGDGAHAIPPIEEVQGRKAYHLELRPQDEPRVHNLRDLWVDTSSYDLVKAHFVGRYAPTPQAPSSPTDVTVYFRDVLGCWVVTRAIWTYENPPISFTFDVQSDEIALPASLPDWLFNAAAYRQRQLAGEPDYLGVLLERMRKSA